jgi:hypothetical protein
MSVEDNLTGAVPARSQWGEWGRLVGILLLVFSPLLLAAAALEALAWRVGETMPPAMISTWQDGAPDRVWRGGDGHSFLPYKLARIRDLKPEIIALGPGRANAFGGKPFAPYSFFNAGLTAWTFDQYRRFLERITRDGYAPRAIVFDLDYWMFSPGFDHYWGNRFDEAPSPHIDDLMRVMGQLAADPIGLWRRLAVTDRVHGLYAVLTGEGFAADGALAAKPVSDDPRRLADDGTGIGVPPAVLGDMISDAQVSQFERFAALAKAKHIALIGVQLPYYSKILDELNGSPDAGIWRQFQSAEWRERFASAGVIYFDFSDMPEYRDKPGYFTDSLDPDARVVADISQRMMADPRVRALLPVAGAAGK